jgi:hypothetical protein
MKKLLSYLTIILFAFGCSKDFTELKPQQNVFISDVFNSLPTTRAAVNGLYSLIQEQGYYGRDVIAIPEMISDNMTRSVKASQLTNFNSMTFSSTQTEVQRMWDQLYRVIGSANAVIANEENINKLATSITQLECAQLVGEAYAIRAMAYFDLAKFYARPLTYTLDGSHLCVPIITKPVTNVDDVVYPARNTAKEVYLQVDMDIIEALKRLPTNGDVYINGVVNAGFSKIRMNRWSTLALKTRVAIYKEDWTTAVAASNEVINSGKFQLFTYGGMFQDFQNIGNQESILEVANNTADNPGNSSYAYLCNQAGYGDALATIQTMNSKSTGTTLTTFKGLYNIYTSTDVRRKFIDLGNRNAIGGEKAVPLCLKYQNISTYLENIKIFRISEMYLSRGEANARIALKNNDATALSTSLTDINLVRKSRDTAASTKSFSASLLLSPPSGSITARAFVDSIIVERRKEFALEGQRLFDLNRTKTNYVKIRTAGGTSSVLIDYSNESNLYFIRTILPIPNNALLSNKNLVQNTGY